jgi:glycosyltransferase involved in cell wall biosynthesis
MSESKPVTHSSKSRGTRTAVLHLCPDLEPDDPGRETVDLAVLTQRSGWRALIASSGGSLVQDAERAAVRHFRMPLGGEGVLGAWRNRLHLERIYGKERPALIHAHGIETLSLACGLSRHHRLPFVADLTQPFSDNPRARRVLNRVKSTQGVVRVPSEFMQKQMIEVFKLAPEQVRLIPPGVDLQWFGAGFITPERLQSLSHALRLPEQASVAFMHLPLMPDMGHRQFLEALAMLKNENIYAIIAGNDRRAPGTRVEIESLITQLGLDGRIVMPDYCMDLPATCWLSCVVVAPNLAPRGQNLQLLAAQAIGRPVIVADTGANTELLVKDETGWVLPPNDVPALADAIREAIRFDTEQRIEIADRTHNFIAETFPQGTWFNGMMGLYEEALKPSGWSTKLQAA